MKNLVFQILHKSGVVRLFRRLKQKRGVTILLFHDPTPIAMERALAYLVERYHIISLESYLKARINGATEKLPDYSMVITFDDGHRGNYSLLHIFEKYGVQATIFLCSDIIDTHRHFWFLEADGQLPVEQLKTLSNDERLDRLATIGFEKKKEYATRQALSAEEIKEMQPQIDFQAHTRFHPILTTCKPKEVQENLVVGKEKLEENFGLRINALAYPNGDYNELVLEETRNAGYSIGLTVVPGVNDSTTDLFQLRRLDVNDTENIHELALKSSGIWHYLKSFV